MTTEIESQNTPAELSQEPERRLHLFAEHLFARLPADAAPNFPPHKRREVAESALEFFTTRTEPLKLRVFSAGENVAVVETVMLDCPFVVDSIIEYFRSKEIPVQLMLHPRYDTARDSRGAIISFEQAAAGEMPESFTHAEIEIVPGMPAFAELKADLTRVLTAVQEVTSDFTAMTDRALKICEETSRARELVDIRDFLRWLVHGGFVFLGYRRYRIERQDRRPAIIMEAGSGLGILRAESRSHYRTPVALEDLSEAHRKLLFDGPPLIFGKTRRNSEVHRRVPMDDITIRRSDERGNPIGFDRFIGLLTSKAYSEEAQHIPVLRAKLNEVIKAEGLHPGSHDYKALVAAFNSFPKEELFRAQLSELRSQLRLVIDVKSEADVRLSLETDAVRGNVIALVIMPRDQFSAAVRMNIQQALATRLGGKIVYYYLALGDSYTARLHFCFAAPPPPPGTLAVLQADVVRLARSWDDLLREELVTRFGHARGHFLATRWLPAFSPHYKSTSSVDLAVRDIEQIERLLQGGRFSVLIGAPPANERHDASELRLYELGEAPILSELMPALHNFGISVLSEDAHEFNLNLGGKPQLACVQAFHVRSLAGQPLEQMPGASLIADALVAVRTDQAEDDPLNALTLAAALSWRKVALLRTYLVAAFQMKLAPARQAALRPFLFYPQLARLFVDLFAALFDPERDTPAAKLGGLRARYLDQLAAVENIADDRMARTLLAMLDATVRTNYFCELPSPVPYTALKFESGRIPALPDTAPLYEIHVDSPRMAGCHLRAGKIARGGIRYSDRTDDYRTEILDLMKTQTVKNAIIVPLGSKGGFIVKTRPGRAADPQAAVAAYTTLMNAMLDLTSNLVDGKLVHPPRVKVFDNDGPYLVVAADKGTAAFSDIANGIAESRGFWLGDAFASGGEHGYDHKKMGITARGAWESAKRHLREMGRNIQRGAPITMVGIGDMSGDVFGNGLLQSDNVKLIAAFDHRHIFIDPDPDPAKSFAERKRLHEKPASQWADYEPALISKGGGVFRRGQKRIQLSPEARAALKCDAAELDADSLVQAILRADVDLLYNGGVGTYVRASTETDAEVGDHANDSCRVAAVQLRCKVVVEGGNLGFTQPARIEYALGGGRINTDAIDNSAGVDMSDHEVNLKILLQPVVARGALTFVERNRHIAAVGEEVAQSVLRDNRDQVLSLSLEQIRSRAALSAFRDHLTAIEQRGLLRRNEAALPTHEQLRERRSRFPGLTRPELAVLAAYTKIDLSLRLQETALVADPYLVDRFLRPYFATLIERTFSADIPRHRLRRELIATRLVNELVDLMGSVFIFSLARDHGIEAAEAVRAWLVAEGVMDLHRRCERLKACAADLSAEGELGAFLGLERATRRGCAWAVANAQPAVPIGDLVNRFKPSFEKLAQEFESTLRAGERERFERTYREQRAAVQQEQLAHELARLLFTDHLLNVISISLARNLPPMEVAQVYFGMSERLEFATLESAIDAISSDDRWELRAARDLSAELTWARIHLCHSLLDQGGNGAQPLADRIARGRERHAAEVERLMGDLRALPSVGLPPLQVTVRALSRLASNE